MPETILKFLMGVALLIAAQACVPGQPTPDLNDINTAIARTLQVASTQTLEPGIPITGEDSATPTASPDLPAVTQTPSATMTAILLLTPTPSLTLTPAAVQVRVSVPTNCRVGPGRVYDRVGGLLVGEAAEVVGRNAAGNYWIIHNPDDPGDHCWLWGEYATVTGNTMVLPVFTPPPSPTPTSTATPHPNFDVAYNNFESCTGRGWWVDFELENHGSIAFNSIALTVRDTVNNAVLSLYADDFTNRDGCNVSSTQGSLPASQELLVSSPAFTLDPRGHELRATITMCSNPGQSGLCTTETITFTP